MEIFLVGGAVRDKLLNQTVTERDWVVVGATPAELLALGYQPVGKDFPVFLHPTTHEEYALARTERKTGRGYTGFTFHASIDVTLEEDLKRRDLTINAIAEDVDGNLIDPFHGQSDLKKRILRHVSYAFVEDPLRILRVARFQARFAHLDFTIAPETKALMKTMVTEGDVDALVPERVWQEMQRALTEKNPEQFFLTLLDCGALTLLFPDLAKLWGTPQDPAYHPEVDTGVHTMLVLQQAVKLSDDPVVRFAALLHDIGKGATPHNLLPSHPEHEARGIPLIKALCERYRVPTRYSELALLVGQYHGLCHSCLSATPEKILELLESLDAFRRPDRFHDFLLTCMADSRGRPGYAERPYPQSEKLAHALRVTQNVKLLPSEMHGLTGLEIKQKLRMLRLDALSQGSQQ